MEPDARLARDGGDDPLEKRVTFRLSEQDYNDFTTLVEQSDAHPNYTEAARDLLRWAAANDFLPRRDDQ